MQNCDFEPENSNDLIARSALTNDLFRASLGQNHLELSAKIYRLPDNIRARIFRRVADFMAPHEDPIEHKYGHLQVEGLTVLWTIDYRNKAAEKNATDPNSIRRVLIITLEDEN